MRNGVQVFSSWHLSIEVNGKYPNISACHKFVQKATLFFCGRTTETNSVGLEGGVGLRKNSQ
jgi:hypothetical protein